MKDFYVDLLTKADSVSKFRQRRQEISDTLIQIRFPLLKWASNCLIVIIDSYNIVSQLEIAAEKDSKILDL